MQEDQHDRQAELAPIYVAEALSSNDALRFEEHLRDCSICRREVVRLREISVVLARAVAAAGKHPINELVATDPDAPLRRRWWRFRR